MRGTSSQCNENCTFMMEGENSQMANSQLDSVTILYYNARSLIPKIDELSVLCALQNPGIVCVVETWLGPNVADSELSIPNYQVIRLDRNCHGGGVLMYVHNCLSYKVVLKGPDMLEFLVLTVSNYFCKLCVGLFYRPPSSPVSVLENFCTVLERLDPSYFSNFVLLGDFNIDFYKPHNPQHCKLTEIMHTFSLMQVVGEATHTTSTGKETLIDWALVSQVTQLKQCAVMPPIANSDHNGLMLRWAWKQPGNRNKTKPRQIWRYAHGDFERANDILSSVDWDQLIDPTDVNQSLLNWEQYFMNVMESCIPKGVLPRRKNVPWLSKNMHRAMQKRNNMYRRAKLSGSAQLWNKFRTMRNKVTAMLRTSKQSFFNRNVNTSNKKQFWKTMKYMRAGKSTIPTLSLDGNDAVTDRDKSSMLNSYFSDCFNKSMPPLTDLDVFSESMFPDASPEELLCTEEEVLHLLQTINISKASGPDRISGKMLKATALSIAAPVTKIFNISIMTGVFPTSWKLSSIVPIPKGSDKGNPKNYRPISLLPILSKLLEKHICGLLADQLQSSGPINESQFGCQQGKSTTTTLLETTHNWLNLLES